MKLLVFSRWPSQVPDLVQCCLSGPGKQKQILYILLVLENKTNTLYPSGPRKQKLILDSIPQTQYILLSF